MAAFQTYRWPGNVRELKSAIERAAIVERSSEIRLESMPDEIRGGTQAEAEAIAKIIPGIDIRTDVSPLIRKRVILDSAGADPWPRW